MLGWQFAMAQSLAPRAYIITPVSANAVTVSWSFYDGGVNLNGTIPITGATGSFPYSKHQSVKVSYSAGI